MLLIIHIVILRAHDIMSWWFYNYRHIVSTILVVLLHKIRHTLTEIWYIKYAHNSFKCLPS